MQWQNADPAAYSVVDQGVEQSLESQFQNHDIQIEEVPQHELFQQNSILSEQGTEFFSNDGIKSLMSRELNLVIESNPVEVGDNSKKNLTDPNLNMINMGDHRQWASVESNTFDLHHGFDLTQNQMMNVNVGNRQFDPYANQERACRSMNFVTQSSECE